MWTLNRLPCGPRTGFQIGHFVFFVFLHFWSKFQTFKNQFEQRSGRFVVPVPALKMGPRNQAKNRNKNTKKCKWHKTQTFLSAEKSLFGQKNKKKKFDGLGLLAFLWSNISSDSSEKHYKTRGFVVFCCVFGCCCPNNKNETINQQTQPSKQEQTTTTKQQSWPNSSERKSNTLQEMSTTPNARGKHNKTTGSVVFFVFLGVVVAQTTKQNNRTTEQQTNNKNNNQN